MYDIRVGRVGIFANYGTKEEKLLTELQKGENSAKDAGFIDISEVDRVLNKKINNKIATL